MYSCKSIKSICIKKGVKVLIMQKGKSQNINVFKLLKDCARPFNLKPLKVVQLLHIIYVLGSCLREQLSIKCKST